MLAVCWSPEAAKTSGWGICCEPKQWWTGKEVLESHPLASSNEHIVEAGGIGCRLIGSKREEAVQVLQDDRNGFFNDASLSESGDIKDDNPRMSTEEEEANELDRLLKMAEAVIEDIDTCRSRLFASSTRLSSGYATDKSDRSPLTPKRSFGMSPMSSLRSLASSAILSPSWSIRSGPVQKSEGDIIFQQVGGPEDVIGHVTYNLVMFGICPPQSQKAGSVILDGPSLRSLSASEGTAFLEKKRIIGGPVLEPGARDAFQRITSNLAAQGIGVACKKGSKPEPNQDNVFALRMGRYSIFAIADGHGNDGHWVSHWVMLYMSHLLLDMPELPFDEPAMKKLFNSVHTAAGLRATQDGFDIALSGCTLTLAIVDHDDCVAYVASVGDSRCAAGEAGKGSYALTIDHRPDDMAERMRIMKSGGEVRRVSGIAFPRVFAKGKDVPGIAMSRAIGDSDGHKVGVNHIPTCQRWDFKKADLSTGDNSKAPDNQTGNQASRRDDKLLLLCSDGVWEFMSCEEAVELMMAYGRAGVDKATEALAREARRRWKEKEKDVGYIDDISIVASWL